MKIVILGNICIDKNNIEGKFYEKAGGPPIFMSKFLNNKGENSLLISSYGKDFLPYKKNLNLYPKTPNIAKSLVYENLVKDGKRTQKCNFYDQNFPVELDKSMKTILEDTDCLFVAPLVPTFSSDYIKKVIKGTKRNTLKILLPQGYFRKFDEDDNVIFRKFEEADKILPLFDFVILSSEDYPNIEMLSIEWNRQYGATFILTKAQEGADIINKQGVKTIPTNPIPAEKIINSIGAGDIFSAGFAYHYLKSKDVFGSVEFANKAAAEKMLGD